MIIQQNGHSETKTVDDTKTNGHDKDEAYHSDSNGGIENAATPNDVKGKGKGKGKGKSSQIVKSKSASDLEIDSDNKEQNAVNEEQSKTETEVTPSKKAKSAKELYANLVNDEVMEEESEEDDDNDQGILFQNALHQEFKAVSHLGQRHFGQSYLVKFILKVTFRPKLFSLIF